MNMSDGEIVIYSAGKKTRKSDDASSVEVRLSGETVWLTQKQMAELFDKTTPTINEHIKNVFKERELRRYSVIRKFRITAADGKIYNTEHYNLDVIISVGYRVKSKRGTQFRIWANKILKNFLLNGYAINKNRLKTQTGKVRELEKTIRVLTAVIDRKELKADEAVGLVKVIRDYTYALDLLDQYDHQRVVIRDTRCKTIFKISYEDAKKAIEQLRGQFSKNGETVSLFGLEKDDSFRGSLYNVHQTYDGRELYPSVEEKAANLLYFLIKNHSFIDGNKRIGAFLFIWFLEKNNLLYARDGHKRIEDNALVAICLMIAESRPEEKDTIVKVIVNLINKKNG